MVFKSTTPLGCQALPGGGIIQKQGNSGGETSRVGFKRDVDAIPRGKAFGGQRGSHDATRSGPSFENLDPGPAAGAQGSYYDPSLGDLGPGVFHGSGNFYTRGFGGAGRQEMANETIAAADQAQAELRTQLSQFGPDLTDQKPDGIDIRVVLEIG